MRTRLLAVFAGIAVLFGVAAMPAAAHAPAAVSQVAVADLSSLELGDEQGYNAVGSDRAWNRNAEWVDVVNTSQSTPVNVKGLIVEDAWRHGQPVGYTGPCNRYEVTTIPVATGNNEELPAGHTLRVYVGDGEPKVFGDGDKTHAVYMNSLVSCGLYGHFFNNNPPKGNRFAPWDTAWITLGGQSESKSYRFPYGFTAATR